MAGSVSERARSLANRIEAIPSKVVESFKSTDPQQRVRELTSYLQDITVDLVSVLSWIERNRHPDGAKIEHQRMAWLQREAPAIAAIDVQGYRGGTIHELQEGEQPGEGEQRTATLSVFCLLFSSKLVDWSEDIAKTEAPQSQPQIPLPAGEYDVFISHASEDKDSIAIPLYDKLTAMGYRVWLDKYEITIGDSLRAEIDRGLLTSKFVVAILSNTYFSKPWAVAEFDGIFAVEMHTRGEKKLLPVLHRFTYDELTKKSPLMAGRRIGSTEKGVDNLAEQIHQAMQKGKPQPTTPAPQPVQPEIPARFVDGTKPPGIEMSVKDLDSVAIDFLLLAHDTDKMIVVTQTSREYSVIVGGRSFKGTGMGVVEQEKSYKEAMRQLEMGKYVERLGSGSTFTLTGRGYSKVQEIRKQK